MPISIYAGEPVTVRYDADKGEFRADVAEGPAFVVCALDYFAAQAVMSEKEDAAKVRACITAGLISIDGDAAKAQAFLARPKARLVNPLFTAIWDLTWGN